MDNNSQRTHSEYGEPIPPRRLRALVSVSDKSRLLELCQSLKSHRIEILATGGTARALSESGIESISVENETGLAEMMDGRVKTLHPKVFGGILARIPQDESELRTHNLTAIDIVIVNLYPFVQVLNSGTAGYRQICENIDIGGVALLRAAAKNHDRVCVLHRADQYHRLISLLDDNLWPNFATRQLWAAEAFDHTREYDRAICGFLQNPDLVQSRNHFEDHTPDRFSLDLNKTQQLRYGENPHQRAALYQKESIGAGWRQLQGKQMSYNNIVDSDCALSLVALIQKCACVIVKHDTPCAVAIGSNPLDSFQRAFETDRESSFGGIISFNRPVDASAAREIVDNIFTEIIAAPEFSNESLEIFSAKKNLRLLVCSLDTIQKGRSMIKNTLCGFLVQQAMNTEVEPAAAGQFHTPALMEDLILAWQTVAFAHSNAIVVAGQGRTLGICGGATSRVRAVRHSLDYAQSFGNDTGKGRVLASDAFLPFKDSVNLAAQAGIEAIIQTGGSRRDQEVIEAANEHGIALYFTGVRVFRH